MPKKLRMSLILSNLVANLEITKIIAMHYLSANFVKILEVCKYFAKDLVNDKGNTTRPDVVPRLSDLNVIPSASLPKAWKLTTRVISSLSLKSIATRSPTSYHTVNTTTVANSPQNCARKTATEW